MNASINTMTAFLAVIYVIAIIIVVVMIVKLLKDDRTVDVIDNLRDEEC